MLQTDTPIERMFGRLASRQRADIIYHGALLRVSELNKRLFLAQSKVHGFESKYGTTLAQLEALGVPENASYEVHEDYILWQHWTAELQRANEELQSIELVVRQTGPAESSL